jgi:predicted small lipoprotein YifL
MKRLFTLIVLLGMLGVFAGCSNGGDSSTPPGTNAAPAAPSTNK